MCSLGEEFEIRQIDDPADPDYLPAFQMLWGEFGAAGEMEVEGEVQGFLRSDPFEPFGRGTWVRYYLLVARGADGRLLGVRDGTVLLNPAFSPDLCLVFLSHLYLIPEVRGTALSRWLRVAPVEVALDYLGALHQRGLIRLPAPGDPGHFFGMRLTLAAEMEPPRPEDPASLRRLDFYLRGGFRVVDPRQVPYCQPDCRPAAEIRLDRDCPLPLLLLLRRIGRERASRLPAAEARAVLELLWDDFSTFCAPPQLQSALAPALACLQEAPIRLLSSWPP